MRRKKMCRKNRYRRKRIVAWLLVLAFMLTAVVPASLAVRADSVQDAWDGVSRSVPQTDKNGTYLIRTAAELAWFADEVNAGNGGINARLEKYIYLNKSNTAYEWMMIGNTPETPYKGTFDGNGKQIVYLHAQIRQKTPEYRYAGLFGVIDGGTVKNLTVQGKVVHGYGSYDTDYRNDQFYTGSGGIAGYLKSGTIINCINYTRTTMDGDSLYRNAGGIAGICQGKIIRCENYGKLSTTISIAQNHVGGIAGLLYGVNAQITNSVNHATVQGYYCVGGVAGAVKYGAEINASCNYGNVKGNSIVGGIAGRVSTTGMYTNGSAKECSIADVYNLGQIGGYGSSIGSELGGIAGEVGYESWTQESLPPMPVIERAYSVDANAGVLRCGAAVGYLLSGCYGTVYGITYLGRSGTIIGGSNNRAVKILGEARMVTEDEMKSVNLLEKLGSAFTMSNQYDTENKGFPKLVWQGLASDILDQLDEYQLELNGWLTDNNRKKYGRNYATIESLVKTYMEQLGSATSEKELDNIMKEAREKLEAVKPAIGEDTELAEAIDNGLIALEEYSKKLLKENPELTDDQKTALGNVLTSWKEKLEAATSQEDVRLFIRDGKDALDDQIAFFEADKKMEEVRANAVQVLTDYRATEEYDVVWMHKIKLVRDKAIEDLGQAKSTAEINTLLEKAKADIDDIIGQIPEAGSWDGTTKTEPTVNENHVFQIKTASELAWFAEQVNQGHGDLSAELCADISLGGKLWTPIGKSATTPFTGNFDGMGHYIRGLNIDVESTYLGLFGCVNGSSTQRIQNLYVAGSINVGGRVTYVGGIAGQVQGTDTKLINCHSSVTISVSDVRVLDTAVGGIAGEMKNAQIANCSNTASVKIASEGRGGLTYYCGGILGAARTGARIDASYNTGTVWSPHTSGGLIGGMLEKNAACYSSYNAGEVTGMYYAGGICGELLNGNCDFGWCYTSGSVNPSNSGLALGAVFGKIVGGDYNDLYALKLTDTKGRTLVGSSGDFSACGKFVSEKELKTDEILNSLNGGGNCFIHDYLGFQNGYPILSWQMTLDDFKTGSITALKKSVDEADYTEDNWKKVQDILKNAESQIKAAQDMADIDSIRTNALDQIAEVETKAGTEERKLQEAKDEAITFLENYVDLDVYREEEQSEIRTLISNAKKYILQADSTEEVKRHRDETTAKIDQLPDAWQYEEQVNMAAATQVDSYIMNIGEVVYTAYVKMAIEIARNAYDSLTDKQKGMVSTYEVLVAAEEAWAELEKEYTFTEEDKELAAQVDALIEAIGTVSEDSTDAIYAARLAYDSLTEKQKMLVTRTQELQNTESTLDQIKAAAVTSAITAIGEVTLDKKEQIFAAQSLYEALTDSQKKLVTAYTVLTKAISTYNNLVVAQPVIEQIQELGGVDQVTLNSKAALDAAIRAYNDLTGDQQKLVTNYDVLEALISVYDSLASVDYVVRLIDSIGVVSKASEDKISTARVAYEKLTTEEKKKVTNFETLEAAEAAYKALQKPETTTNPETGRVQGNQQSLSSLYHSGRGKNKLQTATGTLVGAAGSGSGTASMDETGTVAQSESDETEHSASTEAEDENLPSWLENQLNGEENAEADTQDGANTQTVTSSKAQIRHKKMILLLSIMFGSCLVLTISFAVALKKAAKKRREKRVHY